MNSTQDTGVTGHGVGGEAIVSGSSAEGKRRVAYFYDSKANLLLLAVFPSLDPFHREKLVLRFTQLCDC